MYLRATGKITRLDAREGVSTRTGKPWRIPFVSLLIAEQGVANVNVPEVVHAKLDKGQEVDWLVDIEANGGYLQCRFVDEFDGPAFPASVHPEFADSL